MKVHLLQKSITFFQKSWLSLLGGVGKQCFCISSEALGREVHLINFLLKRPFSRSPLSLLLVNDGQDFKALELHKTLRHLYKNGKLDNLLVVGIKAADRMQEYGTAHRTDYARRGSRASQYTDFILQELLPFLQKKYPIHSDPEQRAFAGFSLGGLSALDIVWNHPEVFHQVGVFSGSLWWRSKKFDKKNPDADRIMHAQVAKGSHRPGLRFWLQTGTHDETADRNKNGVIDAIDDTLDLIAELEKLGYQKEKDITYVEINQGEHHPDTWKEVMPEFLQWCFGEK